LRGIFDIAPYICRKPDYDYDLEQDNNLVVQHQKSSDIKRNMAQYETRRRARAGVHEQMMVGRHPYPTNPAISITTTNDRKPHNLCARKDGLISRKCCPCKSSTQGELHDSTSPWAMAHESPSQSRRHRHRYDEAGDFGDERDLEAPSRGGAHSAHRSTHRSSRSHHQIPRPIIIEINGGNNNLGSLLDDQLGRTSRSAAAPTRPNSRLQRKKRKDNLAFLAEDSDTSTSYTSSPRDISPLPPQSRRFREPKTPTSLADEGYGTSLSAGTALQHDKRRKSKLLESEYASARIRRPSTTMSSKKSSSRERPEPPPLEHAGELSHSPSVASLRETPSQKALGKRKASKHESDSDDEERSDDRLEPANPENGEEDGDEYEENEDEDEGEGCHADSDTDGDSDDVRACSFVFSLQDFQHCLKFQSSRVKLI